MISSCDDVVVDAVVDRVGAHSRNNNSWFEGILLSGIISAAVSERIDEDLLVLTALLG